MLDNVKSSAILHVMNMTLSKRGDYVVRSALSLARAWPAGEPRKIREVVAEMGVPQTFASQILADLVKAGLASSKAGKDGGYRLARPPDEIALLEVVEAGEGPLRAERCALGEGPCRWDAVCPLHETWRAATEALREVLGSTTLGELARRDEDIEEGRAQRPLDSHRHGPASIPVEDWVYVETGIGAIEGCLQHEGRVAAAIGAAYEEADALRLSLSPLAAPLSPAHALATCSPGHLGADLGLPRSSEPGASGGSRISPGAEGLSGGAGVIAFTMSWEVALPGGVNSHADVELVARPVDADRTELRLVGLLRVPESSQGMPTEPSVVSRLAQVVVRSFLRRLARELEGTRGDVGASVVVSGSARS